MNKTKIQWTDYTWNPIAFKDADGPRVWACEKVSAGCANCYASSLNNRWHGSEFTAKWMASVTPYVVEEELRQMLRFKPKGPFKNGARPMVFVGDMTDIFGSWVPDEWLDRVFAVMALRRDIDFQVLTKRPERMRKYLNSTATTTCAEYGSHLCADGDICDGSPTYEINSTEERVYEAGRKLRPEGFRNALFPLPNVWVGTSVENQEQAEKRIPELLATPAAVRFVSNEPGLGPVDFKLRWFVETGVDWPWPMDSHINWIIVGGESGPGARPFDIEWARSVVRQCQSAGVAVFVKQLGAKPFAGYEAFHNALEDGPDEEPRRLRLKDRHGANPDEWPEDLRVREWPR